MNGSLLLISCCHYNKKLAWDRRIRTMNKHSCPRAYVIEVDDNDLNVLFHLIYKLTRKQVVYKLLCHCISFTSLAAIINSTIGLHVLHQEESNHRTILNLLPNHGKCNLFGFASLQYY